MDSGSTELRFDPEVEASVEPSLARQAVRRHCGVFTRRAVVDAMLDAAGWREDVALETARLLEPACGDGAFVIAAAERLCRRLRSSGVLSEATLADRLAAYEFDPCTAEDARAKAAALLQSEGFEAAAAVRIAQRWVRPVDFLLSPPEGDFSHVVGNPPYMRWSRIGTSLRAGYEATFPPFAARGDLCVPFLWRSLKLLRPGGRAVLLCSDRWFRCGYGKELRSAIGSVGRLVAHFEAHDAQLFEGTRQVRAYPAISVFERSPGPAPTFGRFKDADQLAMALRSLPSAADLHSEAGSAAQVENIFPAFLAESDVEACVHALIDGGVPLQEAGLQVRCGMALGCASAFLLDCPEDVEPGRSLPFATTEDIDGRTEVRNSRWIADVWTDDGGLVDLRFFPRLEARLACFREALSARACVRKQDEWYRTIDRKNRNVLFARKLVVAGMARRARLGVLPAGIALANSAYAVFGNGWPLDELNWLLRSGPLDAIAAAAAPRFGGSTLRFDGNLLRRVPVPRYVAIDADARAALRDAACGVGSIDPTEVVAAVYGINGRRALSGLRRFTSVEIA